MTRPAIPDFEGAEVSGTSLKIITSTVLDLPDVVLRVDDVVHLIVEARVTSVNHQVHTTSGRLIRLQTAKPFTAQIVPYVEGQDDGVLRE